MDGNEALETIKEAYDSENFNESQCEIESEAPKTTIEYETEISNLSTKILRLENTISDLKLKNQELSQQVKEMRTSVKKNNIFKRTATINPIMVSNPSNDTALQIAEITREKNDLQEMNEKMLNMLTEKEIENEDLREEYETYKKDKMDIINDLNEKVADLEEELKRYRMQEDDDDFDEVEKEFMKYREGLDKEITNCKIKEDKLKEENNKLMEQITKLKSEIQDLEVENIQWLNLTQQNEKMKREDERDIVNMTQELNKMKVQLKQKDDNLKSQEAKYKQKLKERDLEIKDIQNKLEFIKKKKEFEKAELSKENTRLQSDCTKFTKDLNLSKLKITSLQSSLDEANKKILDYKSKIEKKTNELKDYNANANKIIANKENIIEKLDEKIKEITKDKSNLIEQNRTLLIQMKNLQDNKPKKSLMDIMDESKGFNVEGKNLNENNSNESDSEENNSHEHLLLKEEIKSLKETIQSQANELVQLAAVKYEFNILKEENEKLKNEFNEYQAKYKTQQKEGNLKEKQLRSTLSHEKKKSLSFRRLASFGPTAPSAKQERQISLISKMREDDKKRYEEQIDKLNTEIAEVKVRFANISFESEKLIVRYRKIIHRLVEECRKKGLIITLKI